MFTSFFIIVLSYLLGAFPTGKLVSRMHGVEIEKIGSGNVGATNLARTIGKKAGVITLIGDAFKGMLGVFIGGYFGAGLIFLGFSVLSWSIVSVVLGHCISLPGMRGGKGVATALGTILYLSIPLSLFALVIFAAFFYYTRYVSASSIAACLLTPITAFFFFPESGWPLALALAGLIVTYRHKDNIQRLTEGREVKFEFAKRQQ